MNFKKIVAGIAAAAMAVSMMAVSVFADSAYNDTFSAQAQELDASAWTTLYDCVDTKETRTNYKDKDMLVYIKGDAAETYLKIAGNIDGKWDNSAPEGTIEAKWADYYNAETGCVAVPYSIWGRYSEIQLGIEKCTVYGVAFDGDADTIAAIEALMAGGSSDAAAEETTEVAAEAETTAPTTGNAAVAAIASVMAVAGAAAIVSKKRN